MSFKATNCLKYINTPPYIVIIILMGAKPDDIQYQIMRVMQMMK